MKKIEIHKVKRLGLNSSNNKNSIEKYGDDVKLEFISCKEKDNKYTLTFLARNANMLNKKINNFSVLVISEYEEYKENIKNKKYLKGFTVSNIFNSKITFKITKKQLTAFFNEGEFLIATLVYNDRILATSDKFKVKCLDSDDIDLITYKIYWNSEEKGKIIIDGDIEKANQATYIYYDKLGVEHIVCTCPLIETNKMQDKAETVYSIPKNYVKTKKYPYGGDAGIGYIYSNGDIIVEYDKTNSFAKDYGLKKYKKGKGNITLVKMEDKLEYEKGGVIINYTFRNSMRRYCSPDAYAGFIGTIAELGRKDIKCTGMCFFDATSYPSVSHPNGDSADTAYFSSLSDEQKKVNAFKKFNFTSILRGNKSWYPRLKGTKYSRGHNDHLHAGEFRL